MDGAVLRDKILSSAGRLFQTNGYACVSLREIALKTHISQKVLANTFPGKEIIAVEVIRQQFLVLRESLQPSRSKDLRKALGTHVVIASMCSRHCEISPLRLITVLASDSDALPASVLKELRTGFRAWARAIEDTLHAIEETHSEISDVSQKAFWITAAMQGLAIQSCVRPNQVPPGAISSLLDSLLQ